MYLLRIFNNLTKKIYEFPLEDMGDSRLFLHFRINPEDVQDFTETGEYTYNLLDMNCSSEGKVIATGLLQVGDYKPENNVYDLSEENGNTYIQYNI